MKPEKQGHQLGTFGGVFTPSILTILGVIMFMRANYVLGQAGIFKTFLILVIAKSITLLTAFSISAISTNTPVKGGGAYFLISRSLGPEFGGSIGLALFLAQTISIPFYLLGFTEALTTTFPSLQIYFKEICLASTILLFLITFKGADLAVKVQYSILGFLGLSIISFFSGAAFHFESRIFISNVPSLYLTSGETFWGLFAIYFPAVTGIMAGVNMSGDLKDPAHALPRGTLWAVGVGFLIYMLQIILCSGAIERTTLIETPYTSLLRLAPFHLEFLVIIGVFAATISSAFGSFLGAPRILQALARDDLFFFLKTFAKGSRTKDEPRRALWFVLVVTLATLWMSGGKDGGQALNLIAAVITMFFLYTYGMTNLAAFIESFGKNPSFRPRFRFFHWTIALAGTLMCFMASFLIDPLSAGISIILIAAIYSYVKTRVLSTTFRDARRGFYFSRVRDNLFRLNALPHDPKNWHPTILVLSGDPKTRWNLVRYGIWLENNRGILTLSHILVGSYEVKRSEREINLAELKKFIEENHLYAFPEVVIAPDFITGLTISLQSHSIGPLKPNILMVGWTDHAERSTPFFQTFRSAMGLGMSVAMLIDRGIPAEEKENKTIDLWWRGYQNGSLMLILAFLMTRNWEWTQSRIRILRVVKKEEDRNQAQEELEVLSKAARIETEIAIIVSPKSFQEILKEHSAGTDTIFLGMKIPPPGEELDYYQKLKIITEGLPSTILVASTGEADLLV
jgi:amino acid transporter